MGEHTKATYNTNDLDQPRAGHYLAPIVRNGPLVPIALRWRNDGGDELMTMFVGMEEGISDWQTILDRWPYLMDKAVPEAVYQYALDNIAWHQAHDPSDPHARPYEAVSFVGHNEAPGDEIVAAEKLVETAKAIDKKAAVNRAGALERPVTADIAERAINAVKAIRIRKEQIAKTIDSTKEAAVATATAECADHIRVLGELNRWQAAMQAIAHEARSAANGNIKTTLGFTASQKQTVAVEVVDRDAVPHQYVRHVKVINTDAILEAARAAHKAGEPLPEVPGVKITVVKSTVVS